MDFEGSSHEAMVVVVEKTVSWGVGRVSISLGRLGNVGQQRESC